MVNLNPQTLTDEQHNVLIGSLLGDGCLGIRKNCVSPRLTIRRQFSDLPYIQYEFEIFRNCCRDKAITIGEVYDKRYDAIYKYCNLETRYIPAFKAYHSLWYPDNKKIIPPNLELNSQIIAIWVCDDAYIRTKNQKRLEIHIHTQGFSKNEVIFLIDLLNDRYNSRFRLEKVKNDKYIISGSDYSTRLLLKDIDPVFPKSMIRKSNIWRNEDVCFYANQPKISPFYNASNMKKDIVNKFDKNKSFSMKEICQELNLYHTYPRGNSNCVYFFTTAKRFFIKLIEEGYLIKLNSNNQFSINDRLLYVKDYDLC